MNFTGIFSSFVLTESCGITKEEKIPVKFTYGDYYNIVRNIPVKASSEYSSKYKAENILVHNTLEVWGSKFSDDNEWIYMDFLTNQNIEAMSFSWYLDYYATLFNIYISDDKTNWKYISTIKRDNNDYVKLDGSLNTRYLGLLFREKNKKAIGISYIDVYIVKPPATPY